MNRQLSIRTALVIRFVFLVSLPLLILGLVGSWQLDRFARKSAARQNLLLGQSIRNLIFSELQRPWTVLEQMIGRLPRHEDGFPDDFNTILDGIVEESPFFETLYLVDRQGLIGNVGLPPDLRDQRGDFLLLDLSRQDIFRGDRNTSTLMQVGWSDTFFSLITGQRELALVRPIGENFLVGILRSDYLHSLPENLEILPGLKIMVLDRQGTLIFSTSGSPVNVGENLRNVPPIRAGLAGQEGMFTFPLHGTEHLGSVFAIAETGWIVLVTQNLRDTLRPARHLLLSSLAGLGIFVLAAGFLALELARRFSRPLKQMEAAAAAIAGGRYDTEIPGRSYLELESMGDSFRIMADAVRSREIDLESRIRERTRDLENANRELEAFSYSVSHDLRAPLRAIHGFTRILQEDFAEDLPPEARRSLGQIGENCEKMRALIGDLLDFSRLGRKPLDILPVDLGDLAEKCFSELGPQYPERQVEFLAGNLPVVPGDPVLLKQVFLNLIGNALKFSSRRDRPAIELSARQEAQETIVCVQDNGVGFDPAYRDKLFGVFQRLHRQDEFEGTGVGLAIVERIVRRHGGRVWATAEVDKGATFCFTLPRGEPEHHD